MRIVVAQEAQQQLVQVQPGIKRIAGEPSVRDRIESSERQQLAASAAANRQTPERVWLAAATCSPHAACDHAEPTVLQRQQVDDRARLAIRARVEYVGRFVDDPSEE